MMRHFRLAIAILFSILLLPGVSVGESGDFYSVRFTKNYDGDTATFLVPYLPEPFTKLKVRIQGIDTPERKSRAKCKAEQILAARAKMATYGWLSQAKTIDLRNVSFGLYGRMQADIVLNADQRGERDLADLLIRSSLAVKSEGKRTEDWCSKKYQALAQ